LKEIETNLKDITPSTNNVGQQNLFNDTPVINYRSPAQVREILKTFGFQVESTSLDSLKKIDHPFAKALIEHRRVSKLISSFAEKLPKHINPITGRIHPEFLQHGTDTGRFTCQNPNLQQIPQNQEWRDLFVAVDGYKIITADYSQIELRILAEYSKDDKFLDAYKAGQDLHARTASEMFHISIDQVTKDQRNIAKTINFGLCYGMSAAGLSERLSITTDQAEEFINAYFRAYPQVKKTLQKLGIKAVTDCYSKTLLGRRRYYKKAYSFSSQKSIERKGRNTPIQGTCGDILKKAIFYLMENLKNLDARIINLVHDEIIVECREEGGGPQNLDSLKEN